MPAPSEYPDWNLNRAGGSETAPSSVEVDDGYSITDVLRRGHLNWFFGALGRWVRWFFRAVFRSDDLYADQMVPAHNDPPATGAGLTAAAGDFSARVYVNGNAVGPVDGPAHTYTATTDTYWDLDDDGVWTAVEVPATDPAPAVTANAIRCYMLRTDATARTTVTSFVDSLDALHVDEVLEFDARPILPATGAFARTTAGRDTIIQSYDTTGAGLRSMYQVRSGLFGEAALELALNVAWIAGINQWTQTDPASPSYLYVFDAAGLHVLWADAGAGTWPNTVGAGGDWTQIARVDANGLHYVTPRTRFLSIPGASATLSHDASRVLQWVRTYGAAGSPNDNWAQYGDAGGVAYALFDLSGLPNGALVTAAQWVGAADASITVNGRLRRYNRTTGAQDSFTVAGNNTWTNTGATVNANVVHSLTMDASSAIRTVNHDTYDYALVLEVTGSDANMWLKSVEVTCTVTAAD